MSDRNGFATSRRIWTERVQARICTTLLLAVALHLPTGELQAQAAADAAAPRTAQSKARLRIRLLDEERQEPVRNAQVDIYAGEDAAWTKVGGKSDAAGRLDLEVPASTPLSVSTSWITFLSSDDPLAVAPLSVGESRDLTISLPSRFDAEIHVRVLDLATGLPVANAQARVLQSLEHIPSIASGARAQPSATSNGDGRLSMRFPRRHGLMARVNAAGYGPVDFRLARGISSPTDPLVLRLSRSAALTVNVVNAAGKVEPGLEVVATVGPFDLKQPGGLGDDMMILGLTRTMDLRWQAKITEQGAMLNDLAAGVPLRLEVRRGQQVIHQHTLQLAAAQRAVYSWTMSEPKIAQSEKPGRIAGQLLDQNGKPIADQGLLCLRTQSSYLDKRYWVGTFSKVKDKNITRTGKDGRFVCDRLQPGNWWVSPMPEGVWTTGSQDEIIENPNSVAPLAERFEIKAGQSAPIVLRRERGLYVRGRVVDNNNAPVANMRIRMSLLVSGSVPQIATRSAADGSFSLGPVDRYGVLQLFTELPLMTGGGVQVEAGDSDLLLRVRDLSVSPSVPTLGRMRVRVLDAASSLEAVAAIDVVSMEPGSGNSLYAVADGNFVRSFSVGRKTVAARTAAGGFAQQIVDLRPGAEQTVELRVQPGVWLILWYQGELRPAEIRLVSEDQPKNYTGAFDTPYDRRRMVVAPGTYSLQFLDAGKKVILQSRLTLAPGEREFVVDLSQRSVRPLPGT